MDKLPLVSIVVPSYNHELYIKRCIESVISQTYAEIQLIVIDDGSTDRSREILTDLSARYNFIFLTQNNKGLSKTLNDGIRNFATGKYISVLASDDYWCPEKIELQVQYLENNNSYAMVFGKSYIVNEMDVVTGILGEGVTSSDLGFDRLLFDNKVIASTVLLRKNIWNEVGGFNEDSYIEDWDLWLKVANRYKIGFINKCLGFYRRHDFNMSNNLLKMENAKGAIIEQWRDHPLYEKSYKHHILQKASVLATKFKTESLKLLWNHSSYMFNQTYIKALVKLLIYW